MRCRWHVFSTERHSGYDTSRADLRSKYRGTLTDCDP